MLRWQVSQRPQPVLLLQFYRVEVKVLPPEPDAAPRTRSVLRRFTHFTKLYGRVSKGRSFPCKKVSGQLLVDRCHLTSLITLLAAWFKC